MPVRRRVILNDVNSDAEMEPFDVGEGIAQTLPVVVALLEPSASLVMIEQPELHVHPAVQVGLGELLIEAIQNVPRPMIIETHSEHLLLRLLRRIRETHEDELPADHPGLTPENLAVYYVEQKSGSVCVLPLRVDETGEFEDRWPHGFFEERADELFS
jgi:predicted ATPase